MGGNRTIIEAERSKFDSSAFGRIPLIPVRNLVTGFRGRLCVGRTRRSELASAICHLNGSKGRVRSCLDLCQYPAKMRYGGYTWEYLTHNRLESIIVSASYSINMCAFIVCIFFLLLCKCVFFYRYTLMYVKIHLFIYEPHIVFFSREKSTNLDKQPFGLNCDRDWDASLVVSIWHRYLKRARQSVYC